MPNNEIKVDASVMDGRPQALDMTASLVWLLLLEDKKAVDLLDRISEPDSRRDFLAKVLYSLERGRENFDRLIELVRRLQASEGPHGR